MIRADLHGRTIKLGDRAKLSGGYADSAVPVYLVHEAVRVVGFGRTRVEVMLLSSDYVDRPTLRVLPRTLVLDDKKRPKMALRNDEAPPGRQR